ncbi:flagellar hook-associated protein FlgL [Desulfuromonas acetoxidans]|uniref:flagellar hook-associated protein FlgL n=1 Tax=Desulfuromonas acetoxidans TaxID=891 RepID=UPI002931D3A2|nr:flagellar hook-associated protein FlgL [Desulfuromonas acetoxidans]
MKSTQATTFRTLNSELNSINNQLENLRTQEATGKKLNRPSDDPAAIRPVLSARTQIRASERFISSMETSLDRLDNLDSYLDQAENLLVNAKETTINAINASMSDADMETLADSINYVKTSLMSVANAQVGGQYIFAGYLEDTPPFTEENGVVVYNGDSNIKKLETAPGEYVETSLDGASLFMGLTDLDGDGVLEQTGTNLFAQLTDLERAIRGEAGQVYNGATALPTADIGYLDAANGDFTPIALDGGDPASPVLDASGNAVPLTFGGEPIALQPLMGVDGEPLSIADYNAQFPPGVTTDSSGAALSATALEQPMYVYNDGTSPVDFDAAGQPVLLYDVGVGVAVSGLTAGSYTTLNGTAMSGPTTGGGDLTIGDGTTQIDVAASNSAIDLATNLETAATAAGLTVTATAADSTSGSDLFAWTDVTATDPPYSLTVEGINLFAADADGVTAADVDAAVAANAAAFAAAGVTVSGSATGGDLAFSRVDGDNLDIVQDAGGATVGFTDISNDGSGDTYYGEVTITSGADFTIGGANPSVSLLPDGAPLQLREVPDLQDLLARLETSADGVRSSRSLMGNNAARIETSKDHMEGVLIDLQQILSRYEDVDLIDVITEITQTETALEAALSVTGRVGQLSILNYL